VNAYVDTSVLLRLVLGEQGRLGEWSALRSVTTSALTEVECLRSLDRLALRGALAPVDLATRRGAIFALLEETEVVELDRPVLARASDPFPTPLGTLDAIHLATALLAREQGGPRIFATHDAELAVAARAMGFAVLGA
jgi:predicted nucleic acid-binding protein